ncbi:hypothetical protein NL676_021056 [Syzygium grande]|nr:hypothetical protein NL676_021056 [Syzygium grande]
MDEEGRVTWADKVEAFGGSSNEKIGKAERLRARMDKGLGANSSCSVESVTISCLNRDPSRRPSMVDIMYALCKSRGGQAWWT